MELYFDADNGALLYKTKEGYYEIVKTNAQLDPTHVRIDESGHLYLKSYVDDSENPMMDAEGNLISLKGPAGDKGDKGDKGLPGEQGLKGDSGINGFTPTFDITDNGELVIDYAQIEDKPDFPWTVNIKGPTGDPGKDGQTPYVNMSGNWAIGDLDTGIKAEGKDGTDGKDGHTYTPSVDFNGNLSWRISDLEEIPSPINIKGPKGDTGEKGENGKGFEYSFPVNPKLGDTFIWGGESGLNDNCFLGYVMTGQQYVYSQLPSKLGLVFANEKTCLVPMHVMIYIPDLLQTDLMSVQFDRSTQIQPLAFNEDQLVESLTTTTNALGKEEKYMSWAVSYGLTDLQIKQLQPYIINIAKSIFDNKVTEYTTNYASTYQMPKYLQGSAMKCKYSNFLEGGTIFNKLFTYLQENPSNIFTGLQQAIADKLSENADYNPDVYIIPIQAVDDSNLSKSWISEMPELPEGWAPCDSVLHNGFNTNQVGNIYEIPEIGGGDTEM